VQIFGANAYCHVDPGARIRQRGHRDRRDT
jgi:hypothetical protein